MRAPEGEWTLQRFLFGQPEPLRRLARTRISVGLCVVLLVAYGAFDRFFVDNAYLYLAGARRHWWLPQLGAVAYHGLRLAVIVSASALAIGFHSRVSAAVASVTFFMLNGYTSHFVPGVFNYDTHLNFFLVGLCWVDSGRYLSYDDWRASAGGQRVVAVSEGDAFVLAAMQVWVAVIYWQALLAKLTYGGLAWFTQGRVVMFETAWIGTAAGKTLLAYPVAFPMIGAMTGLFELCAGFAFLKGGSAARWAVAVAIGFHLAVWAIMNISFFHLIIVAPWLFIYSRGPSASNVVQCAESRESLSVRSTLKGHHTSQSCATVNLLPARSGGTGGVLAEERNRSSEVYRKVSRYGAAGPSHTAY